MMDFMPTTLTGLLLFVVLLLPGIAYVVGRERHTAGQQFSAFRETAIVVAASVSFELIVLVAFAVIRTVWPGNTPDVGALVRNGNAYLRGRNGHAGHYGQVAIWAVAMLAVSVALAYAATFAGFRNITTDNRAWLSEQLGVALGSIDPPLWRWLEDLNLRARGLDVEQAFRRAAKDAAGKRNPAGFLRHVLPRYIADQPLWREREEAWERAEHEDA
jgi:Family of unknown function (DUF6338)